MNKPLTLKAQDFRTSLCNIINEANLPAYVLLTELSHIAEEIKIKDDEEIKEYDNSLKKGSEEECKK